MSPVGRAPGPGRQVAAAEAASSQLSLFESSTLQGEPLSPPTGPSTQPPRATLPGAVRAGPDAAAVPPPTMPGDTRADRQVLLGEVMVPYRLQRARRRSIGMIVGPEGLSVRAPRWVGLGEIEAALRDKSRWILKRLVEQRERVQRLEAARIEWLPGALVPVLGELLRLQLDPGVSGARREPLPDDAPGPPSAGGLLRLGLASSASASQIRDAAQAWLQHEARRVFEERVAHYAPRLGVRVQRLSLSNARTRWGSASADGHIRLNWRLIHFALPTIDYVVVHELAHLRHMDHSPRFWDVVRSIVPDPEQHRAQLRDSALGLAGD